MASADLLVSGARLLVTMDSQRRELSGGWVAITGGQVSGIGSAGSEPPAGEVIDASGCLVTPGLINTHHHIYQNLTRSFAPAVNESLFGWLTALYPLWAGLDEEAAYLSAWVGLAELALGGCTSSMDHLYVHPKGGGDLLSAEIKAAQAAGDADRGETYYRHWLAALERLVAEKQIAGADTLAHYQRAWEHAAERTPHGAPISLSAADFAG